MNARIVRRFIKTAGEAVSKMAYARAATWDLLGEVQRGLRSRESTNEEITALEKMQEVLREAVSDCDRFHYVLEQIADFAATLGAEK